MGIVNKTSVGLDATQTATLEHIEYVPEINRVVTDVAFQTTNDSGFYGFTQKINVVGDKLGGQDLISGEKYLNAFRTYDPVTGSAKPLVVSRLEMSSTADAQGWQTFQPTQTDTITITSSTPLVANFVNQSDAFVTAQRFRGLSGKLDWKIESPSAEDNQVFLPVFDSGNYPETVIDFDNPSNPSSNEDEVEYPFEVGYRLNQVLRLTFYSSDGGDVEVLGDQTAMLPYFATRYVNRFFDHIYDGDTRFINATQVVDGGYDYEVDTSGGAITMTVPSTFTNTFTVSDANAGFTPTLKCTVDFSAFSQGDAVLQTVRDAYKFYYDGTTWHFKDLDTKGGGTV